ncbi:Uncharacterized protein PBTT_06253 [Plasmodiophora brassicae]|uniref:Uncharacterized protein n=1 Tax=Plasmodiophora brassicae TaxID=37360 RepID=A0A0G4J2Z9_PLABS|nr:hypothetical protein PBRA_008666 [Plasmodiophora brassicae]SPQ98532.1 unnamed protein product [Plasmodiophora brassicae]
MNRYRAEPLSTTGRCGTKQAVPIASSTADHRQRRILGDISPAPSWSNFAGLRAEMKRVREKIIDIKAHLDTLETMAVRLSQRVDECDVVADGAEQSSSSTATKRRNRLLFTDEIDPCIVESPPLQAASGQGPVPRR